MRRRISVVLGTGYILAGLVFNKFTLAPFARDGEVDGLASIAVLLLQLTLVAYGVVTLRGQKTLAPQVTLLLVTVLFSLVAIEVFIRVYIFGLDGLSPRKMKSFTSLGTTRLVRASDNPELIFELVPNSESLFKLAHFESNSEGWRDRLYSLEKPEGVVRIAVVGDSFTMGSGIEIDDVYHSVLESRLNAEGREPRFEFLSFGVGTYDVRSYTSITKEEVLRYDPDLILIGFCPENDYVVHSDFGPRDFIREGSRHPFLRVYSMWVLDLVVNELARAGPAHGSHTDAIENLRPFLTELGDLSKAHGVPIVVAYLSHLDRYVDGEALRGAIEESGMRFVDAGVKLRSRSYREVSILAPLDVHPNAEANRVFADSIWEFVEAEGLSGSVPR
jgi:hypothetical protein